MTSEIETPRLILRPLTEDDEVHFVKLFADPRVTRYITLTEEPMPREWAVEALRRNLDTWQKYGYGPWSAIQKVTGRWIDKIDLIVHEDWPGEDKTEVGWELDPAYWGQGLATEGGSAAIRYGFTELELPRIISVTTLKNVASLRVMEKCGLRYQGRIRWRGVECVWYALDRLDRLAESGSR